MGAIISFKRERCLDVGSYEREINEEGVWLIISCPYCKKWSKTYLSSVHIMLNGCWDADFIQITCDQCKKEYSIYLDNCDKKSQDAIREIAVKK